MGFQKPAWLEALYAQKFFVGCSTHETSKKNEKNIFCLDCCTSICPHCLPSHRFHRLLQIRRYVYHDVVRLEDLDKLIDCSNVQPYTINSAKVVFIKKRPQSRQFKGSGNYCTSCDRSLQEPYIHCSLGCKVEFVLKQMKDLSPYLRNCKTLQLSPDFLIPQDMSTGEEEEEEEEMMMITNDETPNSTVVDSEEPMSSSSSGSLGCGGESMSMSMRMVCSEFVRKKRSSGGVYVCARLLANTTSSVSSDDQDMMMMATSMMSRRKGIPHRSPLC
ncbi:protein RGF1 INDUCIBLE TRANSCRIPTION FACTOR 1-like [Telopea speciosissima]|uniref:protein RGF1 INDUCIBLE TRANSCRIPTION FACTOR 1-like n=1 Tax=Telopea speciosissima TaxID=54955 RepID=UPI001CC6F39D|nr:protein RGF1 INDUCIBLE TRANSCRIPTION FACTOR 1-like [Telopea speciosissima]